MITRICISLALVLGCTSLAHAQAKLEVTGTPKKAEVTLGEDIEIDVAVKNAGETDVDAYELEFDARSVSFEIALDGGTPLWDTRFLVDAPKSAMEPDPLTPIVRKPLKKGETWTKTFTIPAVIVGSWAITTNFAGTTGPEVKTLSMVGRPGSLARIKDQARTVKVLPGPKGEVEVGVKVSTTVGTMTWAFGSRMALCSALNFVRLAKSGWYEGRSFHRIDKDLGVVQGGATDADGGGHFPWSIPRELGLKHTVLSIGMARSGDPNSGGSQFYIVTTPAAATLDRPDGYAIFARVVRGKDVVETLFAVKTVGGGGMAGQKPATTLRIESVKPVLLQKQD